MKTYEILFTLEDGVIVQANSQNAARMKGIKELERVLGEGITRRGYFEIEEIEED